MKFRQQRWRNVTLATLMSLVLWCITTAQVPADDEILASRFNEIDTDGSDSISREEFKEFLTGTDAASAWAQYFNILDSSDTIIPSLIHSFIMTLVTELGDKTFCIAAIMAMQKPKWAVFFGASMALLVMTVLSVAIGYTLPSILPKEYTHWAAAALFLYFGAKLLLQARTMEGGDNDELEEAEEEIAALNGPSTTHNGAKAHSDKFSSNQQTVDGNRTDSVDASGKQKANSLGRSFSVFLSGNWKTITQVFTMTFLAEWGDRSQIATIAMAASKDPIGIALGGFVAHSGCTLLAILGGRLLASKINERTITIAGGVLFLLFAIHAIIMGPEIIEE